MTKKHYIKLAEILSESYKDYLNDLRESETNNNIFSFLDMLDKMCEFFATDNPNFNKTTFINKIKDGVL